MEDFLMAKDTKDGNNLNEKSWNRSYIFRRKRINYNSRYGNERVIIT
jgi:hypothetical protein